MVSIPGLALRAWEFVWTLVAMALIGNVIQTAFGGNPSSINYAMFTTVIAMLTVLIGLGGEFINALAIPMVMIVLDSLSTLFTFIAGVVLAAELGVHSCGNSAYTASNHLTNGAGNRKARCQELQASTAFFWFLFAAFAASAALSFMGSRGSSSLGGRGGIRKGGPSMSQV